jgi:CheY-like chemotaxis protein
MSHEIRTPLNGILGFTDILSKRELDPDTKRYIDIINKSGQTLLNVVNDILDFSKLESGELSLHEIESNLFEEMEAAVATFSSLSKKNAIEYYTYIDPNIPKTLICDVQRLKQVLNNLISNAMKFTRTGGNVAVNISLDKLSTNDARLYFSVKDSGIGIAKEKLPTIFKEFSQADSSISREFGGTGLGLAISNRYINMMGANISVTSEEGEGSIFSFFIDLPIVNHEKSLERTNVTSELKISILYSKESNICNVNENVTAYLSKWQCNFSNIYSLDELNAQSDILIICAQLFDTDKCQKVLSTHPKLHILYIEGVGENMICENKRFHLIEQPMTGSAIFDKLISFSSVETFYKKETNSKNELKNKFEGKVLIAEDNETNQMLISIMLEERNIEYKIVDNGQKAVDILRDSNDFNLVFMDINMPILDGINATKILRELGYSKPIVSLSANVIESDIKMYLKSGIDATLNKPIVPKELDKILTTYLSKQKNLTLDFDDVDIFKISELISIKDTKIVQKLLNSFKKSASSFIERLEIEKLDEDTLHTLKGMSGNLRFLKMYKLIQDFELHIERWSEEENIKNRDILLAHLKNVNRQIELINK